MLSRHLISAHSMAKKLHFKTIIISDVHLGTEDCKIREVNRFLKATQCDRLILNGDIIDGWQLSRSARWTNQHTQFVRLVLKKVEKEETEVVYLRGNHDGILSHVLPLHFDKIRVQEDYVLSTSRGQYLILHGDIFDMVTQHLVIVAKLGDIGYQLLLRINRAYNTWRLWRGLEYDSISKRIKARVKSAVNFVSKFEQHLTEIALNRGCQGVVCGHIHVPADKHLEHIHYLNCGDWVETMSAVVEHLDGKLELLTYDDFRSRLDEHPSDEVESEMEWADVWEDDVPELREPVLV